MNRALCFCDLIPRLNLKTKISLVIHAKELKRTTNTGRLALHALSNSEIRVRGQWSDQKTIDLTDLLRSEYQSFLFYPSSHAVELTEELVALDPRPVQLIVPDGSWRQASKVHSRHHELSQLQRVMISTPNLEKEHLRAEHRIEGMSTLMAIAMALGVLEGEAVKTQMMNLYRIKLLRTQKARGIVSRSVSE